MKLPHAMRLPVMYFLVIIPLLFTTYSFAQVVVCTGLVANPSSANVPAQASVLTIQAQGFSGNSCIWSGSVNGPSWASITAQNGGTTGSPGNGSVNVEFQANPDLASRNNEIDINATNADSPAHSVTRVSIVQARNPGSFTLAVNPTSQNVVRGASIPFTVLINRSGGFTGSVCLSISGGLPPGTSAQFSAPCTTGNSVGLTIFTNTAAPLTTLTPLVTGHNGDTNPSTTVSYTVQDFSLSLNPSALTVVQGNKNSGLVIINPINGFSGCVTLSPSNVPDGVGLSFNPNPTCSGSSTMMVNANGFGPLGTFSGLEIDGFNQGQRRDPFLTLTVAGFTLSASPQTATVPPGRNTSLQVTVNPSGGYSGSVCLSVSGVPGVTASFSPACATGSSTMNITNNGAAAGTYTLTITGIDANQVSKTTTVTLIVGPLAVASRYVPVTPCRIADTRNPAGPSGGPFLSGGTTREFDIPNSACGIPSSALAYALNATVVPRGALGYLTMLPCGQSLPLTSNLNSIDGRVKAVAATVPAGTNGGVCAFASNDTDLVLDISGYFVPATNPSALAFYPVTPCRLVDTRLATGPLGGPWLVGSATRTFPILSSSCNVPAAAQAYSLNYTSVPKGFLGYLATWAEGQPQPLVSTLNAPTGTVTANAAIVTAGSNGDVSVFVSNDTDLVIDINGYFAPPGPGGLSLYPLVPCRLLDTRNPAGSPLELDPAGPAGTPPASGTLTVNVTSSGCGAPATAQAYVLNATVIPPGGLGFITLWPNGTPQPLVSTLNAIDGAVTSNMAIVPTINGSVNAFASNPTQLVLDIFGYFAP
jgi:hypothetical protein